MYRHESKQGFVRWKVLIVENTTILSHGSKIFENTNDVCTVQGCDIKA